jgi:hypothetical protein
MFRLLRGCTVVLCATACAGALDPASVGQLESIAGEYSLATVGGSSLPCCTVSDSAGRRSIVGGTLVLGDAAPEPFGATPAGWRPVSCVHEIPAGAYVDTAGVVHLPSGDTYTFPPCGNGSYTMVITQKQTSPDGRVVVQSDTSAGRYAWSAKNPALITLVSDAIGGPISTDAGTVRLVLQTVNVEGRPQGSQYEFVKH